MENIRNGKLEELKKDIEAMRTLLNDAVLGMLQNDNSEVLALSDKMDKLIVEYYSINSIRI